MKRRGELPNATRSATLAAYKVGDLLWIDDVAVEITEYDPISGRIRWVELIPAVTVDEFRERADRQSAGRRNMKPESETEAHVT